MAKNCDPCQPIRGRGTVSNEEAESRSESRDPSHPIREGCSGGGQLIPPLRGQKKAVNRKRGAERRGRRKDCFSISTLWPSWPSLGI